MFCAHGAGYTVSWDQVKEHMHVESCLKKTENPVQEPVPVPKGKTVYERNRAADKELEEIFLRTYGPGKAKGRYSRNILIMKSAQPPLSPLTGKEENHGNKKKSKNICWWMATTLFLPGRN